MSRLGGRPRVLWIEDGITTHMGRLFAATMASGRYDLTPALNASEGVAYLAAEYFDAVVVDVRLPPGNSHDWVRLFGDRGRSSAAARLGLALVYAMLLPAEVEGPIVPIEPVNRQIKVGFLTVEPEVDLRPHLRRLGRCLYARKQQNDPTVLLRLIDALLTSHADALA